MKYSQWRRQFESLIKDLDADERERALSYYAEMYADGRDAGLSEEEAVAKFGDPREAAEKILAESRTAQNESADGGERGRFVSEGAIDAIEINGALGAITAEFYDGEHVSVDYPLCAILDYKVSQFGGKIVIRHKNINFKRAKLKGSLIPEMKIMIPRELTPDCTINLAAGSLKLGGGEYGKICAYVEGGLLETGSITCSDAEFTTDAGKVNIGGAVCHRIAAQVNAGELKARDICGSAAQIRVNAGKLKAEGVDCKRVDINVSMGKAEIVLCGAREDYDAEVIKTIGTCNISPRALNCDRSVRAEVAVGSCNIYFAG